MKFKKPEDLKALDDAALEKAVNEALDEYGDLAKIKDEDITDEQLEDLEGLKGAIAEINGERVAREEAATARAERIAAAKAGVDDADEDESEEDEPEGDADEDKEDEEVEVEDKQPALVASARKPVARKLARRTKPIEKEEDKPLVASIVASADQRGFTSGQDLDMDAMTKAYMGRVAGMPGRGAKRIGNAVNKYGVAQITIPGEPQFAEFAIDVRDSDEVVWNAITKASRENRLAGNSLVAAGGWCAPSQNFYDLCAWETATGALDLPTITVTRGGINFTKGPDFSTIFDAVGFVQTEADAIAGEVKPFLEVDCPDWEEVRLDAIGYGVKAPILTASPAGFPELVRRYLEGALVAHYHHKNAYVINKVVADLGAAVNFTELGSGTGDLLYAIEVAAQSLRYKYRLGENATLEAMFPMWIKSALRADLAYRTGVSDFLAVTDAQIQSWFTLRGIRPQYVYDWAGQDLTGTTNAFPTSVRFGIWPAGTFVKGTNNIISLDAIYDSTEIETNTYTAAFFEEAILVANTCGDGRLFEVGLNYFGRTGAAQVGGTSSS